MTQCHLRVLRYLMIKVCKYLTTSLDRTMKAHPLTLPVSLQEVCIHIITISLMNRKNEHNENWKGKLKGNLIILLRFHQLTLTIISAPRAFKPFLTD